MISTGFKISKLMNTVDHAQGNREVRKTMAER